METLIITVETEEEVAVIQKRVRGITLVDRDDPQFIDMYRPCPSESAYQALLRRLEEHEQEGRIDFAFGCRRA